MKLIPVHCLYTSYKSSSSSIWYQSLFHFFATFLFQKEKDNCEYLYIIYQSTFMKLASDGYLVKPKKKQERQVMIIVN